MKKNMISKLFEVFKSGEVMKDGKEYYRITNFNVSQPPKYVQQKCIVVEFQQTNETGEL